MVRIVLAVQNMQASGTIQQDIEFKALEGSLSMMSKGTLLSHPGDAAPLIAALVVLNDVLDLCVDPNDAFADGC